MAIAAERLAALRAALVVAGVDGFVVPHADEHQSEYLPARAERLAWLTGFTGSAGAAVVLATRAAVFADGRYTLQVRREVDSGAWDICHLVEQPPADWLATAAQSGMRIGYDPWLHTPAGLERLAEGCRKAGATLVALAANPVDAIWADQPPAPVTPAAPHDLAYAGRASADKRADIAGRLAADGLDAAIVTQPDSIAWLLNVRGGDVAHTPLVLSFVILHADATVDWFVDPAKLGPEMGLHLGNAVRVNPPAAFGPGLDRMAGKRVRACPDTAAAWVFERLAAAGAEIRRGPDPVTLPKAIKNEVELAGTRAAHRRDGAALARFFAWLAPVAASGDLLESVAADKLRGFRAADPGFRDDSFDTISGAGPNGAVVHYRVSPATDRRLAPGELYLVDSGAQYPDGTTDVTRTVAVGTPDAEMRDRFTRVLKGHIAVASARFPAGTTGGQLDTLARQYLWQAGLDYDHGTGHGVGSYLAVHEGPQRISKVASGARLAPGMIVSNEPGYYKEGAWGIRIENLVAVAALGAVPGGERPLHGFETLTLAPIDRTLVDLALMTPAEVEWLDAYHARVAAEIGPLVDAKTRAWLAEVCRPLAG